ncbi:2-dehydro-3-deoxy-6-phosphogalactonate aldolase [Notoacmeibacter sp. MSK16QG-6]|uniref:2-dehydro-3-deoxy-6-phosphogalactonate aldolase n=1 Tax=Notoacmeibacter sp. MSK16QG-6 TaxID=2957982 RepID=UPI00209FA615|nr:2-dehydro-3-deoxy-6-phosphogalactonate aldolase [Notoacmeibacter sp. MSK16QG-6]MCP1200266.1 2-dehydro-3-deoxy-6-phosphogalactonate aldolase [Notoacmeibacter sp. MSK16QG-6]
MSRPKSLNDLERPLIAILRGLRPENAVAVSRAIFAAGIQAIEVPLNSPDPFCSISAMVDALPDAMIGAGTVLDPDDVKRLSDTGARLLVTPNSDPAIIKAGVKQGLVTLPGCFTATEAFQALNAGASGLKFFPASIMGPDGIAALKAVLPSNAFVAAVGGVAEDDFASYVKKGIRAFGLGSSLFRPEWSADEISERALRTVAAYDKALAGQDR